MVWWRWKNSGATERRRLFLENGRELLQELIVTCDGKNNPIKSFSADQIFRATDNFNQNNLVYSDVFRYYRGMLDDRLVLIKKWKQTFYPSEKVYRDIAISSMVSGHKNILKLLGCCLEFTYPVLVCEYSEHITCSPRRASYVIYPTLPWNTRMQLAKEIANAVTYLHTAFSRTFVHKDIQPHHIFLDEDGKAKLGDFYNCVSIPEGETFVQDVVEGAFPYLDPKYLLTGKVTEHTDIYSFGMFMLVLLTGLRPDLGFQTDPDSLTKLLEEGRFTESIDPRILENMGEAAEQERRQMEAFLLLSLRCTGRKGDVPKMIEVAKELKGIQRSNKDASFIHPINQI